MLVLTDSIFIHPVSRQYKKNKRLPPRPNVYSLPQYLRLYPISSGHVLEDALRDRGIGCRLLWEIPGPKNTAIAWLTCYRVEAGVVIVETYDGGNGWEAFSAISMNDSATIADVIKRCRWIPSPKLGGLNDSSKHIARH